MLLLEALHLCATITNRSAALEFVDDLTATPEGLWRRDGLAMAIVGLGEHIRRIDREWPDLLKAFDPVMPWHEPVRMRDRLAQGYFEIDALVVFQTCRQSVPPLREALGRLLASLEAGELDL